MKRLIHCTVLVALVLSIAACSRSANEATAGWHHTADMYTTQRMMMDIDAPLGVADFSLPLTGGSSSFFGFGGRDGSAPAPASAPAATSPPRPGADNASSPGQTEWEDMAESGERLVVQNASVELDTEYFREVEADLRRLAPAVNGFVESDMLTTRGRPRFTIVMRVPAASFEYVLAQVESLAYVRVSTQWAQDVTDQFYDMAGSYRIRRLEEERILALIEQTETVQELLALEQRLGNTRRSIETYLGQLNHMAGQVAYSTITVTLADVSEVPVDTVAPTLGERVGGAFGDSVGGTVRGLQNIVVFLAGAVVPMVLLGMVALVVYVVVRKVRRKISA